MDELTAYQILHLQPDASGAEIKAAYAELSKQFHPEEHPEEFQRIHEAYSLLARGRRQERRRQPESAEPEFSRRRAPEDAEPELSRNRAPEDAEPELSRRRALEDAEPELSTKEAWEAAARPEFEETPQKPAYDFSQTEPERPEYGEEKKELEHSEEMKEPEYSEEIERPEYDFERVMRIGEQEEQNRLALLIRQALMEMELLLDPKYQRNEKYFQEFFQKPNYQEILRSTDFMLGLADLISGMKLHKKTYRELVNFYRLRGLNPDELESGERELYRAIQQNYEIRSSGKGSVICGVPMAVVILNALRIGLRGNISVETKIVIWVLSVMIIAVGSKVAAVMRRGNAHKRTASRNVGKKRFSVKVQLIIAAVLMVSQVITLFAELYAPFIGVENGDVLSVMLFFVGLIWMIVVLIVVAVRKLITVLHR